jgi:hypothetical protein
MPKDDVLNAIPPFGYRNLMGTTRVEEGTLEEWGLQAIVFDERALFWSGVENPVDEFVRYFYFVNNKLADMSVQPLQYRDRRDLIIEWRNR